jgi:hypothetical protein
MEKINTNLYGILFTYNCYKQLWYACKSEDYSDLINGIENPNIIYSVNRDTLINYFNEGKHLTKVDYDTKS